MELSLKAACGNRHSITLENSLGRYPRGGQHMAHGKKPTPAVFPTMLQQLSVSLVEYQMK